MNLYEFYHTINILCGFTIFIFCACRLGARQWKWQQLEFWVNLILLPSAVAMVVSPVPSANVLIFRLGVAMYFAAQTWKIWRLQRHYRTLKSPETKKSRKKARV